jgi:hypothetical protein
MSEKRAAWDPSTSGYGKHDYRHIDPETINPSDYARDLRGEEAHFGDVREYNSADNQKHPENSTTLDDLSRIGTVIETEADGFAGSWTVVQLPTVRAPKTFARLQRSDKPEGEVTEIDTADLGVTVTKENTFNQVKTTTTKRGKVDRTQRERLTRNVKP